LAFFPKRFLDFRARDQFSRAAGKERQQPPGLILQTNAPSVLAKLSCIQVQFERFKADASRFRFWDGFH
jgi:hypothetical protein